MGKEEKKTGYIYEIFLTEDPSIRYIGGTFDYSKRWQRHKQAYGKRNSSFSVYEYFDKHGVENFGYGLLATYDVCDRKHLNAYEQLWMNTLPNINKYNAMDFKCIEQLRKRGPPKKALFKDEQQQKRADYEKKYYMARMGPCECGRIVNSRNLDAHRKTSIHLRAIAAMTVSLAQERCGTDVMTQEPRDEVAAEN